MPTQYLLSLILTVCATSIAYAQLPARVLNTRINRAFRDFATTPQTGSSPINSISFDAVNAKVTANGFIPLRGLESTRWPVYASFKTSGDLSGNNTLALFNEGKISSGASFEGKISFALGRGSLSFTSNSLAVGAFKKLMATNALNVKRADILSASTAPNIGTALEKAQTEKQKVSAVIKQLSNYEANTLTLIQAMPSTATSADVKSMDELLSNLAKIREQLKQTKAEFKQATDIVDSLDFLNRNQSEIPKFLDVAETELKRQLELVDLDAFKNLDTTGVSIHWVSIGGYFNRRKYYFYDEALPVKTQVDTRYAEAYGLSLDYNYLKENFVKGLKFYFNGGLLIRKFNDLLDKETTTINQERKVTNDTVTNVIKNAYVSITKPVESFDSYLVYTNFYLFFGKKNPIGLHFFPEIDFRSRTGSPVSFGFGTVLCVQSSKAESPSFTVEPFINLNDIRNSLESDLKLGQRVMIGIKTTIPINVLPKAKK